MLFHSQQFRQALNQSTFDSIIGILGKLTYSLHNEREPLFLVRMTEDIAAIIKGQAESPILKFKTVKMLMYLIVMGQGKVMQLFGQQVYPLIRNACLFHRNQPLITRGMDFFRNNKYYQIANMEERTKIKNIGCRYITFCLECVYMLSQWLPRQGQTDAESTYLSSYNMLRKEGVEFPKPSQFIFFSEDRVKKIQRELKSVDKQAEQLKEEVDHQYFYTDRSKFDVNMMNGVQYLQKKLRQKEKIISQLKNNTSVIDLQKQSYLPKMQEQEVNHYHKVEQYQKKILNLTEEVRNMKDIVKVEGKRSPEQQNIQREYIMQLEAKVQLLTYQNSQLRQENSRKSSVIEGMADKFMMEPSSFQEGNKKIQTQNNLKELLQLCDQPQEYQVRNGNHKNKTSKKHIFFEYKDIKTVYPIYELLPQEMQIRFRKSLLKPKQILFKNKELQIGIISELKNEIELQMTVILTNVSEYPLMIQKIDYEGSREQMVIPRAKIQGRRMKAGEQVKQELTVVVNSIDSQCPTIALHYSSPERDEKQIVSMILPVGKIKLSQNLSFTSHPLKQHSKIQRVITLQRRILSSPSRLKDHLPKCYIQKHAQQLQYCFKLKLLSFIFFTRICPVGEESLRISISYREEHKCLGEKLMDEFQFILGKAV